MNRNHFRRIDLNLLYVFDALMAEAHVSRAAERIGVTQSAVSHALGRLRLLFGDPLFIRSAQGMTPTSVALAAAPAIHATLEQVETVLRGQPAFSPSSSERQFILGLSDYAAFVALPRLFNILEREAPGITLIAQSTSHGAGQLALENGQVELIVGNFPNPPANIRESLLFEEHFVCAMSMKNPLTHGDSPKISLDDYLNANHLQVSTRGNPFGYVDQVLKRRGLRRRVVATIGHFLLTPSLVRSSRLVATEPRRIFTADDHRSLALFPPPLDISPFRVVQAWHSRHDQDPGHVWLRSVVSRCVGSTFNETSSGGAMPSSRV